jgi:hypothetical protein
VVVLPTSCSCPIILVYDSTCPEYRQASSNKRRSRAGLSTLERSSTSREMEVVLALHGERLGRGR